MNKQEQKQKLEYDPIKKEVIITPGFNNENESVMSVNNFLDLCFQMDWEGARYKEEIMRINFEETLWNALNLKAVRIDTSKRIIIEDSPELWAEQVIPYAKDYHFKFRNSLKENEMTDLLQARLNKAIKKKKFTVFEILGFTVNYKLSLLTGAVIGYKLAIDDFSKFSLKYNNPINPESN